MKGLSDKDVAESRILHGANIISRKKNKSFHILAEVIREPIFLLLCAVSIIYFFAGQASEGIIMLFAIVLVSLISIFQQVRSEKAVNALAQLTQPLATVIRNGLKTQVPAKELVKDDVLLLSEGEVIPADANVHSSNDFSVNESILTGESFPVLKSAGDPVYSGTTVSSGSAVTIVAAVGSSSRIGKLGTMMLEVKQEKTLLQTQVRAFVHRMALFGVSAFAVVFIYNFLDTKSWLSALMHGLTIAMAVLPEEIPVALSTFMALGAYRMIRNNVIARHQQTVEALGSATVICIDKTGTVTENKMSVTNIYVHGSGGVVTTEEATDQESQYLLSIAYLASEAVPFDPMETAIHNAFQNKHLLEDFVMIREYPLSGRHPIMTHIYKDEQDLIHITCKGAPEGVIAHSDLTEEEKKKVYSILKESALQGKRVLAIAEASWDDEFFPEDQFAFPWHFLGFVMLSDPPKKNVKSIIKSFYDAGIKVKLITGDFPETACGIASQIGIKDPLSYVTAFQIQNMKAEELQETMQKVNVYARTPPEMKLRIINALKANKEVVAMTGDGVNDAPALKAAHIGVAMGKSGSEVAKGAAGLILVDDDLQGMVTAVALGRKIFSNLKKAIQYIISIHIPLISMVTIPLILGWKYDTIFSPVHIIFLELIMGPTCSIAYENEPLDERLMQRSPNKFSTMLFTVKELSFSVIRGIVITVALLSLLYYCIEKGYSETLSRTMVFTSLIFANILLTLAGRSDHDTMLKTLAYKNFQIPLIIFISLGILILSLYMNGWQRIFSLEELTINQIFICFLFALASVMWIDVYKIYKRSKMISKLAD